MPAAAADGLLLASSLVARPQRDFLAVRELRIE